MDDDSRLETILAEWQEQFDLGRAADPETVIAAHPALADRLRECFAVLLAVRVGEVQAPTRELRMLTTDRYSVFRPVAEGGMGLVYWAIDNDLNREVAFKVIRAPDAGSDEARPASPREITPPLPDTPASRAFETLKQRFLQEAWVTGGMAHPGIVPVYELGQTAAGMPYYTMRLVRGERTLADAITAIDGTPIEDRLQLLEPFLKVCDTIQYAHAQGVIHRDLKPENIALGQFGEVVVLDWGLAKLQSQTGRTPDPWRERLRAWRDDADVRTLSTALGTPGHMAPEAMAGAIDQIDEQSDVYSLGAILFRILTGRAVFEFDSIEDLAQQIEHAAAPSPHEVAKSVPSSLSNLCGAALARNKADRPTGVDALSDGIRQWQAQSRVDREVAGLIREAESGLAAVDGLPEAARVGALDRVSMVCGRVLDSRPDHRRGHELKRQADMRRLAALEERHRAARRRLLTRASAVLLLMCAVAAVPVARALDRRRHEAVVAREDAERNLHRARTRGLVATSAEAERSHPVLALLLARRAVRQSKPPTASALSRLYAALVNSCERALFDGHADEVRSAVFAPAGDAVLTASRDGTARIWPVGDGEPLVLQHEEPLLQAMFSSTGKHVVTRSENGHIAYVWSHTGERLATLEGHEGHVHDMCFSPRGDLILTASEDGTARLWDLTGVERARLSGHGAAVHSVVFSGAGDRILTGSEDLSVRLWDLSGRELLKVELPMSVWEAGFGADESEILVSFTNWTSGLWSLAGEELAVYRGSRARLSSKGDRVVTTLRWSQLYCHDRAGRLLATFSPPGGATSDFEFLPGEHRVAVGCYDSSVRIWDPAGVRATALLAGHTGWIEDISFSPLGGRVLTASRDRSVRLWEPAGNAQVALRGHSRRIDGVKFSPTGDYVLTTARDGTARLWNPRGVALASVPYDSWTATSFSPTGKRFVVCSADHAARVWNLAGAEVAVLRGHSDQITSIEYSRDGREILTASKDGSIRRWDADGRALAVLPALALRPKRALLSPANDRILVTWVPPRPVRYVTGVGASLLDREGREVAEMGSKVRVAAFSPDGSHLATGSYEGIIGIWDADGRQITSFPAHASSVLSCTFSSDGASLLTSSDDMTARLWNLDGSPLAVFRGHSSSVLRAAFGPHGKRILTGAYDQTARLWSLAGEPLATLQHEGNIAGMGFSPGGKTVLTGSFDGAVRIWPLETETLLQVASARLTRALTAEERKRYVDLLVE